MKCSVFGTIKLDQNDIGMWRQPVRWRCDKSSLVFGLGEIEATLPAFSPITDQILPVVYDSTQESDTGVALSSSLHHHIVDAIVRFQLSAQLAKPSR